MKSTVATIAGLFAAGAIASVHNPQHEHLHRRQGYGPDRVSYVTEIVTNTAVAYVDQNGKYVPAPAATDTSAGAGYGQQPGEQVSAKGWGGWGGHNGGNGYSFHFTQPAGGYPTKGAPRRPAQSSDAAPSDYSPTPQAPQYTPPAASQPAPSPVNTPSSQGYQPAPSQQPSDKPSHKHSAKPSEASSSQGYQPAPSQQPTEAPSSAPASSAPASKPATSSSAASSAAAPSSSAANDFQKQVLDTHNLHRANHSVPALQWSNGLASAAQAVAAKCVFAHDVTTGKDTCGFNGYGQNLACTSENKGDISSQISGGWYGEEGIYEQTNSYGEANPSCGLEAGHFTAMVWKSTTHVGCAMVNCPNGLGGASGMKSLTVCDYGPAGNMGGAYAENVLKPKGEPPVSGAS